MLFFCVKKRRNKKMTQAFFANHIGKKMDNKTRQKFSTQSSSTPQCNVKNNKTTTERHTDTETQMFY